MTSVYKINKGINKSIEFKGLKAQYIWWLGVGILVLLILFAMLYIAGLNSFVCVGMVLTGGGFLFMGVYRVSNKYGEFGMMKRMARRNIPGLIHSKSRNLFICKKH